MEHFHITVCITDAYRKYTQTGSRKTNEGVKYDTNISHTARKSSVREDAKHIRVCFVCHGNISRKREIPDVHWV